jgi:serine/threonine protein kinase
MGSVYAAKDPELGRRVAIKLLHPHLADMQVRLLREGQAIARLRHPNVVTIHDIGTHEGSMWIAMELVAGTTLRAWLATPRPWRETLDVFIAAGRGLAAAHAAGLVHRDFKPDNVLLGTDGSIVVTDFGLARTASLTSDESASRETAPQLVDVTQSGAFVGTPAYMSPEQFRGDVVDARSDQFSFCVALFEALYGKRPFGGSTLAAIQHAVLDEPIAPVPTDSAVPPRIHAAIIRGLSRPSGERFGSMEALLDPLGAALAVAPRRSWWP